MILSTNIIRFYEEFGIEKTIDIFSEAGYQGIDFNTELIEFRTEKDEYFIKAREYANSKGLYFHQTHSPYPFAIGVAEEKESLTKDIINSFRQSALLGAEMTVVHPIVEGKDAFEENILFYKSLIPHALKYNLKIAIENIPNTVTQTPEGLLKVINELDNPVFTICFDAGHANCSGISPAEMIRKLGSRIECVHIHDNDGKADRHLLPYYGNINWEEVMKAFAEIGYKGTLNYESGNFVLNLPKKLRPTASKLMAETGFHLINLFNKEIKPQ